jgi:transposase-like protein
MLNGTELQATEVLAKAKRRTFSAKYKRDLIREADACTEPGQIGLLLRREGLYSSNLTAWRREIEARGLAALEPKKRGPKVNPAALQEKENAALRRQLAAEKVRADRAELIVEIQKKVSMILGITLPNTEESR